MTLFVEVREQLKGLVLSFPTVDPRDQIQDVRIGGKQLYSRSHLTEPYFCPHGCIFHFGSRGSGHSENCRWSYNTVMEHLFSMWKALDSVPNNTCTHVVWWGPRETAHHSRVLAVKPQVEFRFQYSHDKQARIPHTGV